MRYAEYLPDPRLRRLVHCYWVFESEAGSAAGPDETIVPDGHPELIFHYRDSFSEVIAHGRGEIVDRQPASLFAGQLTRPLVLRGNGAAGMIGVRFQPWGARLLLGVPMTETTDRWIAQRDLPGRWLGGVDDTICEAGGDRERIAAIERALLARLVLRAPRVDEIVVACVEAMRNPPEPVRLDAMSLRFGLSARQLERRFNDSVGMSPKLLASVLRFRALFDALSATPRSPWLAAAIDSGYFDQAHMIRDFRRFAGAPPQSFLRSLSGLSAALVSAENR